MSHRINFKEKPIETQTFEMGPKVVAPPGSRPPERVVRTESDPVPVVELGPVEPSSARREKGGRRKELLALLAKKGPLLRKEILEQVGAEAGGPEAHRIDVCLSTMKREGLVEGQRGGHFALPGEKRTSRSVEPEEDDETEEALPETDPAVE
jgi:hypothetical protein